MYLHKFIKEIKKKSKNWLNKLTKHTKKAPKGAFNQRLNHNHIGVVERF